MLTPEENDIIYHALSMRAGFIETGDPLMRAGDAERQGKRVKALQPSQMKLLLSIEDLMAKALNGKL